MTEKKENIIQTALQLFAQEGYSSISTAQIARQADVSEGLIFRHFGSKQGLLDYIYLEMEKKMISIYTPILGTKDPKEVIRLTIDFPFTHLVGEDENYWRLSFRLKWQEGYDTSEPLGPWIDRVVKAFEDLGYDQPLLEAQLLERTMNGVATNILQNGIESQRPLRAFLFKKYKV